MLLCISASRGVTQPQRETRRDAICRYPRMPRGRVRTVQALSSYLPLQEEYSSPCYYRYQLEVQHGALLRVWPSSTAARPWPIIRSNTGAGEEAGSEAKRVHSQMRLDTRDPTARCPRSPGVRALQTRVRAQGGGLAQFVSVCLAATASVQQTDRPGARQLLSPWTTAAGRAGAPAITSEKDAGSSWWNWSAFVGPPARVAHMCLSVLLR